MAYSQPQWASDGRRFFYVRGPKPFEPTLEDELLERDVRSGIDTLRLRAADVRTSRPRPPVLRDWVVSPDTQWAAALEEADNYSEVWIVSMKDKRAQRVYHVERPQPCCVVAITHNAMAWSPDGAAVIVNLAIGSKPERRELWRVGLKGQPPQKIETGDVRLRNDAAAISPNGRRVAFLAGDDTQFEIRSVALADR
jgi:hypothetical protein